MPDDPVLLDDTIAALASPPGAGARGIVRATGPGVGRILDALFGALLPGGWQRRARRYPARWRLSGLPVAMPIAAHVWPGRKSFTGQPMVEIHTFGSPPLLEAALGEVYGLGIRPARRGEFTLRAFLAGRIDLVQAEAVLGVIDAHDHQELEIALRQLAGGISGRISAVRCDLLDLLADLEAGLDFSDDGVEFIDPAQLLERVQTARESLCKLLEQASARMHANPRCRVVLAGLPNAGKSTLFNRMLDRDAALVSECRGTTRDYLIAALDVNGLSVDLVDTAGWEFTGGGILEQAQRLREEQLDRADLIVWCSASDTLLAHEESQLVDPRSQKRRPVLFVQTKQDLAPNRSIAGALSLSAVTGYGMDALLRAISARFQTAPDGRSELVGTTASRCRDALEGASAALFRAAQAVTCLAGEELVAIELRDALDSLGRILGTVYTDDVLDRIFSRFCIGK